MPRTRAQQKDTRTDLDERLDEHLDDDLAHAGGDLADAVEPQATTSRALIEQRLAQLPALVGERRRVKGLSLRKAAAEIGVAFTTLSRTEGGEGCPDAANLLAILEWLDVPPAWFVGRAGNAIEAYRDGWADCSAAVLAAIARTGAHLIPGSEPRAEEP